MTSTETSHLLQSRFGNQQIVWASVVSEVIGADRNPQQRKAIKEEVSRTLTEIEAVLLFAIRRGELQESLCGLVTTAATFQPISEFLGGRSVT